MPADTHLYPYQDSPRPDIQALVPASVRSLLDVGCGSGAFGADLKASRQGLQVWGIDPEPTIAPIATDRLDRFISGGYPNDVPTRLFDCVTFCDALEHFQDPWQVLRTTTTLLNKTGFVVASVPNVRYYTVVRRLVVSGLFTYTDAGILDRTHLRFFTRRSLENLFRECGYSIESVTPGFHARPGRMIRMMRLFGKFSVEFRATHFTIVARLPSR